MLSQSMVVYPSDTVGTTLSEISYLRDLPINSSTAGAPWVLSEQRTVPSQDLPQDPALCDRISVLVQRVAKDYFTATEETTQNFGEGDTAAEAVDALLGALREYRAALQDSDPKLFPDQKRHLRYLASLDVL